jgi:alkaline phosphatase D
MQNSWRRPSRRIAAAVAATGSLCLSSPSLAQTRPDELIAAAWQDLDEATVLERIALGSCLDQARPQPIWKAVLRQRPQLFIMMGDNVYGDGPSPDLKELRHAYALQARYPELAEARAGMPFLRIWDDHDYGLNDGGAGFAHKAEAAELFHKFWRSQPEAPEGLYHSRIYGPSGRRVQVIMLDTRYFRSALKPRTDAFPHWGKYEPDDDPAKTMLGAAQWAWLEQELRKPGELRLVVSSIQVLAEGHGFERWGNLPRERDRLLRLIAATGAKGVILLSGDRHSGALYRLERPGSYALVEITSSSLNRPYGPQGQCHAGADQRALSSRELRPGHHRLAGWRDRRRPEGPRRPGRGDAKPDLRRPGPRPLTCPPAPGSDGLGCTRLCAFVPLCQRGMLMQKCAERGEANGRDGPLGYWPARTCRKLCQPLPTFCWP